MIDRMTERREEILKGLAVGMTLAGQAMLALSGVARRAAAAFEAAAEALDKTDQSPEPPPDMGVPAYTPPAGPDGPMPSSTPTSPPPYVGT